MRRNERVEILVQGYDKGEEKSLHKSQPERNQEENIREQSDTAKKKHQCAQLGQKILKNDRALSSAASSAPVRRKGLQFTQAES